jgi:hypothetical protein
MKCDQRRPECSRCLRTKQQCVGYRNQVDLMFRSESNRTKEKAEASYRSARKSSRSPTDDNKITPKLNRGKPYDYFSSPIPGIGMFLAPSVEDIAICGFYHTTLENLSYEDNTRFLHTQLPALYTQSALGSALRLATQAIAYACSARLGHNIAELARERYVAAIKAAERAIGDPIEVKSDETLYAVLQLCGFEVSNSH